MPSQKRGKGSKTKRAVPSRQNKPRAGAGEQEEEVEGAAKRAKTQANSDETAALTAPAAAVGRARLQEEVLERFPKKLTFVFAGGGDEGGENWLDEGQEGTREGRSAEMEMETGRSGTVRYRSKAGGKGDKVDWSGGWLAKERRR